MANRLTNNFKLSLLTFLYGLILESLTRVDVSGLVAGILAVVITAIIAIVLGIYCYKNRGKSPRRGGRYVCNCIISLL